MNNIWTGVLLFGLAACGVSTNHSESKESKLEICQRSNKAACNGLFACLDPERLKANAESIGSNEAECATLLDVDCSQNGICLDGIANDAAAASDCADALAVRTCDDLKNNVVPEPCHNVCPGDDAGGAPADGSP